MRHNIIMEYDVNLQATILLRYGWSRIVLKSVEINHDSKVSITLILYAIYGLYLFIFCFTGRKKTRLTSFDLLVLQRYLYVRQP